MEAWKAKERAFWPYVARWGTALLVVLLPAASFAAVRYKSVTLSPGKRTLVIHTATGSMKAPRTVPEQEGFDLAKVSSDGRLVGWLALTKDCCESYPLPTSLIIMRDGKILRTFKEDRMIFNWSFQRQNSAVAYVTGFPHGPEHDHYRLRRLSDGKLLAEFFCDQDRPLARGMASFPEWSKSIATDCWDY